jgi:hypothetical protein
MRAGVSPRRRVRVRSHRARGAVPLRRATLGGAAANHHGRTQPHPPWKSLTLKVRDNVPRLRELKKSRTRGCGLHPSCVCAEMTTLPNVDTNCTTPSLIATVNGNTVLSFSTHGQQSAAKGSSTTVSRSDIRLIQHLDSSALGLVQRWLLIGHFPLHLFPPVARRRAAADGVGAAGGRGET